jgi:hypothetical protein
MKMIKSVNGRLEPSVKSQLRNIIFRISFCSPRRLGCGQWNVPERNIKMRSEYIGTITDITDRKIAKQLFLRKEVIRNDNQ